MPQVTPSPTPTPTTSPSSTSSPTATPVEVADVVLRGLFPTRTSQYVATVLLVASFLATAYALYRLGPRLRKGMTDDEAEAIQAVLLTSVGVVAGVLLVVIWRATGAVRLALASIQPSPTDGVKVLITVLAVAVAYTVTRITKQLVQVGESRDAITNHQREVLHHLVQILVMLPAVVFAIALWDVPAENLLLSASVLGVVLGLAARQTLGAVLAGFILLFSRPFEVGDWVEIDDNEGIVIDVSIVNTRLQTFDDELVMLPNDQITESAVVNRSRNDRLRVQEEVGVDYETDLEHAAGVATEAMEDLDVLMDGPKPDVVVEEFGDSSVVLGLRFWIENPTVQRKWAAQNAVMEAVKEAFEREGISIPFPQRVLAGRAQTGGLHVTGAPVADETTGEAPSPDRQGRTTGDGSGRSDDPAETGEADR